MTPTAVPDGADGLAASVRLLIDALVRTQVEAEAVRDATHRVDAVTELLSASLREGAFTPDPQRFGSSPLSLVSGAAHPIAPPADFTAGADGVDGTVTFGTAYEGPPGLVHGGALSLLLDHALGQAALAAGRPGMTVRLDLEYLAPTPLWTELTFSASVSEVLRKRVVVTGSVRHGDRETVRATGTFFEIDRDRASAIFPHLAER